MPDTAVDAFPDPVVSTDDHGIVVRCNPVAAALLHVSADAALGRPVDDLLQLTARDDSGRYPARRWVTAGQITVPVELTAWQSSADGVIEHHLCLRDATQRVADEAELARAEALLRRQAPFDALTGLANSYELEERLTAALAHSRDGQIACVVVGLDGANTSAGHSPGPSPRPPGHCASARASASRSVEATATPTICCGARTRRCSGRSGPEITRSRRDVDDHCGMGESTTSLPASTRTEPAVGAHPVG